MRKTTHERLEKLESNIEQLLRESKKHASRYHETCRGLEAAQAIDVPVIRDGKKVLRRNTVGGYPIVARTYTHPVSIRKVLKLLAEKCGVELVYHDDEPGKLAAAGRNEFTEPEDV